MVQSAQFQPSLMLARVFSESAAKQLDDLNASEPVNPKVGELPPELRGFAADTVVALQNLQGVVQKQDEVIREIAERLKIDYMA